MKCMKFGFLSWGVMLLSALALPVHAQAMETAAKQAIMVDASTNTVIYEKNADEMMHPSSMSKLMTLYVLFSRMKEGRVKPEDTFTVSEKAWRMQGSKTFVNIGGEITVEDLIHGIVIQSGNDACIVVAEGVSGSEEAFVKEMNRIGKEIGLTHSTFTNSTGWPEEGHLMTARDLATLASHLINDFPDYYHYFAMKEYTYNKIKQHNRNRLLGVVGVDGLKTGHTEAGGYGITLSAKQGERRLILVVNGMSSDNERVAEGDKILRYGFREFENRTVVKKGQKITNASVWFGQAPSVPLLAGADKVLTVPLNTKDALSIKASYSEPLPSPVTKGTEVGKLTIQSKTGDVSTIPLIAGADVPKLSGLKKIYAMLDYAVFRRNVTVAQSEETPAR